MKRLRLPVAALLLLATMSVAPSARAVVDPRRVAAGLVRVASGIADVTAIAAPRDGRGRLFFAQQNGIVKVRTSSGSISTYLDLRGRASQDGGERGLLGLAFHPRFSSNGYFFVDYTQPNGDIVVARYSATPSSNRARTSERRIIVIPHRSASNHNGGAVQFGPDGYLYVSAGDGGGGGDPDDNGQDLRVLLGKILRIDVDHSCGSRYYCIPSGNPYRTSNTARREIWQWGLRNPWRFSFDRSGGTQWIADVGQNAWEEVDRIGAGTGGRNLGWDCLEARARYQWHSYCSSRAFTSPLHVYNHASGRCAVTGGYVYRGRAYRSLANGMYVYADYCSGEMWGLAVVSGHWVNSLLRTFATTLRTFGESETGELYVGDGDGHVSRVKFAAR
jgi:glucose/arabinose dehydrogenase